MKARLQPTQALATDRTFAIESSDVERIYLQRARQLAVRPEDMASKSDCIQVLTFTVETERVCVPLSQVVEIMPHRKCTPIPGAPPQLTGVTNVRGRICAVLDLSGILELSENRGRDQYYIVLVRHEAIIFGLKVDNVDKVETLARDRFEALQAAPAGQFARYIVGRTEAGLAMLSIAAICSHPVFVVSRDAKRESSVCPIADSNPCTGTINPLQSILPGGSFV